MELPGKNRIGLFLVSVRYRNIVARGNFTSLGPGWLWVGLGHVRRAAACPVWLPESAERSRAGGG
eukprot:COSAG05_NODE_19861_length_286_cov_27.711230_1_plen_64_part_01